MILILPPNWRFFSRIVYENRFIKPLNRCRNQKITNRDGSLYFFTLVTRYVCLSVCFSCLSVYLSGCVSALLTTRVVCLCIGTYYQEGGDSQRKWVTMVRFFFRIRAQVRILKSFLKLLHTVVLLVDLSVWLETCLIRRLDDWLINWNVFCFIFTW